MIAFIKGVVEEINLDSITISQHGLGFNIGFVQQDKIRVGDSVKIFTYLNVREDALNLFGFLSQSDLDLFKSLISVKGIGPKGAMNLLSKTTSTRVIMAIEDGDITYLKTLPGIGPKSASQIVLDLKGKLVQQSDIKGHFNEEILEAISGLRNLGYKQSELNSIEKELVKHPDLSVDEYLKMGLQLLMKLK